MNRGTRAMRGSAPDRGAVKTAKSAGVASDARRAIAEGHTVFAVQLWAGVTVTANLTRSIPHYAEVIEAVEAAGWRLDQCTFVIHKNKPTGYLIFRRTGRAAY